MESIINNNINNTNVLDNVHGGFYQRHRPSIQLLVSRKGYKLFKQSLYCEEHSKKLVKYKYHVN